MSGYHMGINLGHDRSVAVVKDGEVVVAIEQERSDRIKHSVGLMLQSPDDSRHIQVPGECIRYCLDAIGASLDEIPPLRPTCLAMTKALNYAGKFSADIAKQVREIQAIIWHMRTALTGHQVLKRASCWWSMHRARHLLNKVVDG